MQNQNIRIALGIAAVALAGPAIAKDTCTLITTTNFVKFSPETPLKGKFPAEINRVIEMKQDVDCAKAAALTETALRDGGATDIAIGIVTTTAQPLPKK